MNLDNFYHEIGEDYAKVRARLLSEVRIRKLLVLFLRDPSFAHLQSTMAAGCQDEAIRAAHTLKGTALNLGFGKLSQCAVLVLGALQEGNMAGAAERIPQVQKEYEATISAIRRHEAFSKA